MAALPLLLSCGLHAAMTHPARPVEVLRDRWGIPHIYAHSQQDLFFVQGWIAAHDRLFQLDLWRRAGSGHLAEVLGPAYLARDRFARLMRYRGDMKQEWSSYAPDAQEIVTAFTDGINRYIHMLEGRRTPEFRAAGFDPGLWTPEDCLTRIPVLSMTGNVLSEIRRSQDVTRFGLETVQRLMPPEPLIPLQPPAGVDLSAITQAIVADYIAAAGPPLTPGVQGSNNWVVDGTRTETGKPLLANDPHRRVSLPSLRKTWHLVAPGWDVIGAGEPALPGIALGHNEDIAFGFTTVGTDQQDLYVEKLNPGNAAEYRYRGEWKKFDVVNEDIAVKGQGTPAHVTLHYSVHGPILYEDLPRHLAYALRWVGSEPGGAGYLAALSLMRTHGWDDFTRAAERWKTPSENMAYADRPGNIGWIATGQAPIRHTGSGLFPVPGDSGDYEWDGFVAGPQMPRLLNPPRHWIATANNDILPPGYKWPLSHEWDPPDRYDRIRELLHHHEKLDVDYLEDMQQDIVSLPARRLQRIVRDWTPPADLARTVEEFLKWDARMRVDSRPALIYEVWMTKLPGALFGSELGARLSRGTTLSALENKPAWQAVGGALYAALGVIRQRLGPDPAQWTWGRLHQITFEHPLGVKKWSRGPFARPGDNSTINATGGADFRQEFGASYREILDLADWDRSVTTNAPGESGEPTAGFYDDLIDDWQWGEYHPLLYTRPAVEKSTVERMIYPAQ